MAGSHQTQSEVFATVTRRWIMTKRKGWAAVAGNFFAPPLGHLYVGKPLRAIATIAVVLVLIAVFGWSGAARRPVLFYMIVGTAVSAAVWLWTDAWWQARKAGDYQLKWYNRWYVYLALIVGLHVVARPMLAQFRGTIFGYNTYRIPSSNMLPTIRIGELVVADAREPADIRRGQIIVFDFPPDPSVTYIKRVIGLPGELVTVRGATVLINGVPLEEDYLDPSRWQRSLASASYVVPAGSLFVLGDNRDNSLDSRRWGFVPISNVRDEVTFVWYSPEPGRIGTMLARGR